MYPVLLDSPRITTYGFLVTVAMVVGWIVARWQSKRTGIESSHIDLLAPLLALAGVGGAWLLGQLNDVELNNHHAMTGHTDDSGPERFSAMNVEDFPAPWRIVALRGEAPAEFTLSVDWGDPLSPDNLLCLVGTVHVRSQNR